MPQPEQARETKQSTKQNNGDSAGRRKKGVQRMASSSSLSLLSSWTACVGKSSGKLMERSRRCNHAFLFTIHIWEGMLLSTSQTMNEDFASKQESRDA
mmetsp:Transcript_27537/g.64575  ORF Transcript_27537/g.64575 Transcript_27537/m.64575 type:complete len:98 (+) Transcript_27537:178-471(+)